MRERSHTKKGPGRYAGRGKMVTIRPLFDDIRIVREPRQRLAPAIVGGNWQGQEYLTMAEHDRCVRAQMQDPIYGYVGAKLALIAERKARPAAELPVTVEG